MGWRGIADVVEPGAPPTLRRAASSACCACSRGPIGRFFCAAEGGRKLASGFGAERQQGPGRRMSGLGQSMGEWGHAEELIELLGSRSR